MYTYRAVNYGMGRPHATLEFQAYSDSHARAIAEAKLPGKHAVTQGGGKGRVLGIKKI